MNSGPYAGCSPVPAPLSISDLPTDLVAAVNLRAAQDACLVGEFLKAIGCVLSPEQPRSLPRHFLLELGAVLRLLAWENANLTEHLEAGLPSAVPALREVFLKLTRAEERHEPSALAARVLSFFVERCAWNAPHDLEAELIVEPPDDDAVLEALADFLWHHRPQ